jgi:hypothetical protein
MMIDDEDEFEALPEDETEVDCPYCGELVEITLDPTGGAVQQYVEECPVCCQPWTVNVVWDEDGNAEVTLSTLDE